MAQIVFTGEDVEEVEEVEEGEEAEEVEEGREAGVGVWSAVRAASASVAPASNAMTKLRRCLIMAGLG